MYHTTNNKQQLKALIDFLIKNQSKLESISDKIEANTMIQSYYAKTNDLKNLKLFSERLSRLNNYYNEKNKQNSTENSDLLNNYIIKNVNQKYDYQKGKALY